MLKKQSVKDALLSASVAAAYAVTAVWWFIVMSVLLVFGFIAVAIDKAFGICLTHSCK